MIRDINKGKEGKKEEEKGKKGKEKSTETKPKVTYSQEKHREWSLIAHSVFKILTERFGSEKDKGDTTNLRQISLDLIYQTLMMLPAMLEYRSKTEKGQHRYKKSEILKPETLERLISFMKFLGWDYVRAKEVFNQNIKVDDKFIWPAKKKEDEHEEHEKKKEKPKVSADSTKEVSKEGEGKVSDEASKEKNS